MLDTLRLVPRQGRRAPRALRVAGAGLVTLILALLMPWASSPASALVPPRPPAPSFLTNALSGVAEYAGLPAGVVAEPFTVVMAGVGAYQGTCYALQGAATLLGGDGDCDLPGAAQSIYNLVTTGSFQGGVASYSGPDVIIGHGTFDADGAYEVRLFANNSAASSWNMVYVPSGGGSAQLFGEPLPFQLRGVTIVVPHGNDPNSWIAAYNAAVTACGCGSTDPGVIDAPSGGRHWVLSEAYLWNSPNKVADWQTGYAPGQLFTAKFTETCTNTDGSTFTESASVGYVPTAGGKSPDVTLPNCWDIQPGAVKTNVGVTTGTDGGSTVVETANVPTVDPGIATKYPDCATTRCILSPEYVPAGVRCLDGTSLEPAAECVDYWPSEEQTPSSWKCFWGGYRVPLSYCEDAYPKKFFETGTREEAQPSTSPSPSAGPSAGGVPTTGANPTAPGSSVDSSTDPDSQNCWGSGWSLNPVSWVYVPVKCAMKWAFVPKTPLEGRVDDVKGKASGRFPFSLLAPLAGLGAAIPSGNCPEWNVVVKYPGRDSPGGSDHTLTKNVVCDSSYTSAIRTARPVFAGMMMVTALWPMIRGIVYGSFPIVKPVPTR